MSVEPPPQRLAYSIPEAARTLGVHRATLYRLADQGKLRLTKIAGRTVIQHEHLKAMLDAHTPKITV